jgi:hypothetical protein
MIMVHSQQLIHSSKSRFIKPKKVMELKHVAQAGSSFKLSTLLPQPPKCWGYHTQLRIILDKKTSRLVYITKKISPIGSWWPYLYI